MTGAFYCFGCGAHGGDVLQFLRVRYGFGFTEAAAKLGALDKAPTPETIRRLAAEARERERQAQAEELRKAEQRARILECRENLLVARQLEREVTDLLDEIHNLGGDEEAHWLQLSLLANYTRDLDAEYCAVAGLEYLG